MIVVGRSNSGKSTLLNKAFDAKLSTPSKTPGSTKKLYFLELAKHQGLVVDAPGYGFTKTSTDSKKKWRKMVQDYVRVSSRVCQVVMLVNLSHGFKTNDQEVLDFILGLKDISVKLVLTKADKVGSLEEVVGQAGAIG